VFQRIGARRIAIDDLGAFNALVGIIGGIGLLGLGLQVVIARMSAPDPNGERNARSRAARRHRRCGDGRPRRRGRPGPAWYRLEVGGLIAVSATATFCGVAPRARLLGRSSWTKLGAGLPRRFGSPPRNARPLLDAIGTELLAVLTATALSEIVMSVVARGLAPARAEAQVRISRGDARRLVASFVALGGLWALTIADTVLARTQLADADADAYAFASTVARSTFLRRAAPRHLALPTFMREDGRTERLRRVFSVSVLAIGGAALACAAVIVAAPGRVAGGHPRPNASLVDLGIVRLLAVAWAAMSVLPLLTYFHSARHPRLAFVPAGTAVVVLGAASSSRNLRRSQE
jgi:hypothetical protein